MARTELCGLLEEPARKSQNDAGSWVQDAAQQRQCLITIVSGDDCCVFAPKPLYAVAAHSDWHRARELSAPGASPTASPTARPTASPTARRRHKITNKRGAVACIVTAIVFLMIVAPASAAANDNNNDNNNDTNNDNTAPVILGGVNVTVPFRIGGTSGTVEVRLLRNGSLLAKCFTTGRTECDGEARALPVLRVADWSPPCGEVFFPEAGAGTYVLQCCDADGDCEGEYRFSVGAVPATTAAASLPPATRPSDRPPTTSTPPWWIAAIAAVVILVFAAVPARAACLRRRETGYEFSGPTALCYGTGGYLLAQDPQAPPPQAPPPSPAPPLSTPPSIEIHAGKDE
ncbi:uncharacterized protein LOC142906524 [Petromyzon marinus]|uniref:uncharacterized protein LOC142906524 n=1 Tax=Petromyzon marinus TaxID=7757 RepID=UPI003F6ED8B5